MKIQTNAGEVELTAEMVRPGMVFQSEHWRCADAPDGVMTMARPSDVWCGAERGWTSTTGCGVIASTGRLLGCDPIVAAREDVERYGVAPGIDAGAHGFARLRGGGAVDLRREAPPGSVFTALDGGQRYTTGAAARFTDKMRFVGMNADPPTRPEDVARLCCGAAARCADYPNTKDRCTLAIGDHDTHEDLATGTRWAAKVAAPDASRLTLSAAHDLDVPAAWLRAQLGIPALRAEELPTFRIETDTAAPSYVREQASEVEKLMQPTRCPQCLALASPGQGVWCSAKCRDEHARESADVQRALAAIGEDAKRRATEAPLVALVAAVPKGLDPVGWRAAVLSLRERHVLNGRFSATEATVTDATNLTVMLQRFAADIARGVTVEEAQTATNSRCLAMTTAYARAIAKPGPRPVPERKRGDRAVRLTVDDGSDD